MERQASSPGWTGEMPVPPSSFLNSNFEFRLRQIAKLHVARSRGHRLGRFRLVLGLDLYLRLLLFLFWVAHFDAALEDRAFFDADAMRDDVAREHTFAANVQSVRAIDVALHLAHDHNFFYGDVRRDRSVAADGDASG